MKLPNWQRSTLALLLCLPASLCVAAAVPGEAGGAAAAPGDSQLRAMDDSELAQTSGQALFNLSYLAPSEARDKTGALITDASNANIGFYKLGLEGKLEVNANIRKLQLGCGGANGAGACDVDIDYFSLSGTNGVPVNPPGQFPSNTDRAASDAILTNPFFQLAVKNPNDPATREIVGFRISAELATGLLSMGLQNTDTPAVDGGLNSFSGYMVVRSDSAVNDIHGQAYTAATPFNVATPGQQITGTMGALSLIDPAADFITSGGQFMIPAMCGAPTYTAACTLKFSMPSITMNGSRYTKTPTLSTQLYLPNIYLGDSNDGTGYTTSGTYYPVSTGSDPYGYVRTQGGLVKATVTKCYGLACLIAGVGSSFNQVMMHGAIKNMKANITFDEDLNYIHSLPVNSPFSLSLQRAPIKWPGAAAADVAQRGWWMSFADPIYLGSVDPANPVDIMPLFPQIAAAASNYLASNHPMTNDLGGLLGLGVLDVNIGTVDLGAYTLNLPLSNLKLAAQNFAPNCWGTSKFC